MGRRLKLGTPSLLGTQSLPRRRHGDRVAAIYGRNPIRKSVGAIGSTCELRRLRGQGSEWDEVRILQPARSRRHKLGLRREVRATTNIAPAIISLDSSLAFLQHRLRLVVYNQRYGPPWTRQPNLRKKPLSRDDHPPTSLILRS